MSARISLFPVSPSMVFEGDGDFRHYLRTSAALESLQETREDLNVILSVTDLVSSESVRRILTDSGFDVVGEQGAVWRVSLSPEVGEEIQEPFEAYLELDLKHGLVLFYTNFRRSVEIAKYLKPILRRSARLASPVLHPSLLEEVLESLLVRYPSTQLTEFTARGTPAFSSLLSSRDELHRTFQYWGLDGADTYQEVRAKYGVTLFRAVMDIPELATKIRVAQDGSLAFCHGDVGLFMTVLEEQVLPEVQLQHGILQRSRVEQVKVGTSDYSLPIAFPVIIRLETPLQFARVQESLEKDLERNHFHPISYYTREGSVYVDAVLVDAENESRLRLKGSERWLKLIPSCHTHISTLLRFYQVVLDEVDPRAVLEVDSGSPA